MKRLLPQFPTNRESVFEGQSNVENYQVVGVHVSVIQRLLTVNSYVHGIAMFAQTSGNKTGDLGIILGEQQPHSGDISITTEGFVTSGNKPWRERAAKNAGSLIKAGAQP
jgi:hypothetical protein